MNKEIIYRTQITVKDILAKDPSAERRVLLKGEIARCTNRRLLGIIPLPDSYKWETMAVETVKAKSGDMERALHENTLTFESRKRLAEERLALETWLRGKCKEYRRKYGKRG